MQQQAKQTKARGHSSLRRLAVATAVLLVTIVLVLTVERVRGQRRLAVVKRDMERRAQVTDITKLLPESPRNHQEFTNQFEKASRVLGESWLSGGGNEVRVAPGKAARGSQAPCPVGYHLNASFTNGRAVLSPGATNTWVMLEQHYETNRNVLAEVRDLLRDPPAAPGVDYLKCLRGEDVPNYMRVRVVAQVLNDVVVMELHRGDLAAAGEYLLALAGLLRLDSQDPRLVGQMIRVAIEGLAAASLWDAVQADGWSEPQLERLQKAWQSPPLLPGLVRALHYDRLAKLEHYDQFRQRSYRDWCEPYRKILEGFGATPRPLPAVVEAGRHYFFHPLWRFAWANQEMAAFLERSDFLTVIPQKALKQQAFAAVKEWFQEYEAYNPPFAKWRFYLSLPLVDTLSEIIGQGDRSVKPVSLFDHFMETWVKSDFSLPNYARGFATAARNENLREMAVTSLALKRYYLRQRRFPDQLAALVPGFLSTLPTDWMDGQSLRYRLNADGTYTLYSVGDDGRDDGGDPTPAAPGRSDGRDLLWPSVVPWGR